MLETGQKIRRSGSKAVPVLIAAVLATGIAAFTYFEWRDRTEQPPEQIVLTPEARDYLPNLDLTGVEMSAADNALGQTLVEITGKIVNLGERPIQSIRINCVFFDVYGIELHRVLSTIVRPGNGLAPSSEVDFRLPFDAIPEGWNQVMPSLYIAEIVFE